MIALAKSEEPELLKTNAKAWTAELLNAIKNGVDLSDAKKGRYNQPAIKQALLAETHKKCAYCESNFLHVAPGHIEHVEPKSPNPALTYVWPNLTIACHVCNTKKGVKEGLFDPYDANPAQSFRFEGPMLLGRPTAEIARATVAALQLNRTELLEKRKEELDKLESRVIEVLKTKNASARKLLLEALLDDARKPASQYSAFTSQHIENLIADGLLPRS